MAKTTYMWDELSDNVAAEYEDGVLSAAYTHEPGLYGNLLSENRNGVTSYYHFDGRGDTVALTDDSSNVTDTKEYDAWGNVIASVGSTATPYQFGGRQGYQTGSTGNYVRARMYQPTVARWVSKDPLVPSGIKTIFVYVRNCPVQLTDPSGLIDGFPPYLDPIIFNTPPFLPHLSDPTVTLPPWALRPPCSERETWQPDYCDECPACKCSQTHQGQICPATFPFDESFKSLVAQWGEPFACEIHIKLGDCGMNDQKIAWTCRKVNAAKKSAIFICLPSTMTTCEIRATLAHEAFHAVQNCKDPNLKFWPKSECIKNETPAWKKQCEAQLSQSCCVGDPLPKGCQTVNECVTRGVDRVSCNSELRGTFFPCTDQLPKVWPNWEDLLK